MRAPEPLKGPEPGAEDGAEGAGADAAPDAAAEGDGPPAVRRRPWSEFRAALEAAGFRPSRGRGQNFLLDGNMARAIARDAPFAAGDFVLEIGPGCGFLSVHLAERGGRLTALEIEPRLAEIARGFLEHAPEARVVVGDALASKHRLGPELLELIPSSGPWHVVSNLPYSISGPILALLTALPQPPTSITVLVQLEVAQRLCAAPGDAAFGALTARVQRRFAAELVRRVPSQLFWPRPRVESGVARLTYDPSRPVVATQAAYDQVVEVLFQQRRKSIRSPLARLAGSREAADSWLAQEGWDPRLRPEVLGTEAFERLATVFGGA